MKIMAKVKDITGQRFGRLVALECVGRNKHGRALWKCNCDCGGQTICDSNSLKNGRTTSCGCKHSENGKILHQKCMNTKTDGVVVASLRKKGWSKYSKHKGVSFHKTWGKYFSHITLKGKTIFLGYFDSEEEAYKARLAAEKLLHIPFLQKDGNEKKIFFLSELGFSQEEIEEFLEVRKIDKMILESLKITE